MFGTRVLNLFVAQLLATSAFAETPDVGRTVAVTKSVILESGSSKQPLFSGNVVHQDEIIVTGIDAKAEVELLDRTKLAIGPEARFVLDRFVYDASASSGSILIRFSKGAMRFLTGIAPKDSYEIRTPTALLGTRGTVFDVYVSANGETGVLLHDGIVQFCNLAGSCQLLGDVGTILYVGRDGVIQRYSACDDSFLRRIGLRRAFPFVGIKLVIDPIRRLSLQNFECRPPRQPSVITAQRATRPTAPSAAGGVVSPEVANWSGLYIGIDGGFGWGSADLSAVLVDPKFDVTGGFAGSHIGYNWQRDRAVFGIEADLHGAGIDGFKLLSEGSAFAAAQTSLHWFSTVRGRLGYTLENLLLYATGGFAVGGVEDKLILVNPITSIPTNTAKNNQTATGYAVGGGLQFLFNPSWSAKLEYQYLDFGSETLFTSLISGETATARFVHAYDTMRVGLSYHLTADYEPLK
jgi:outer membrane immunogenic protein